MSTSTTPQEEEPKVEAPTEEPQVDIAALRLLIENSFEQDPLVVSELRSDGSVPIAVFQQNKTIQEFTTDLTSIIEAVKGSKLCSVDAAQTSIICKNMQKKRTKIFLRDVSKEADEEDIKAFFESEGMGSVHKVSRAFHQNFVVEMSSEESARAAVTRLTQQPAQLKGNRVRARLKAEPRVRSSYPAPTANVQHMGNAPPGAPMMGYMGPMGPRGAPGGMPFFQPQMMGYHPAGGFYSPYMMGPYDGGFHGAPRGRGGRGGRGQFGGRGEKSRGGRGMRGDPKGGRGARRGRDAGNKGRERFGRSDRRPEGQVRGRDGKRRGPGKDSRGPRGQAKTNAPVPEMSANNFPSLPPTSSGSTASDGEKGISKTPQPRIRYTATELFRIVKMIPGARISKPEAMNAVNAPAVILDEPQQDLTSRQRTVSMEMVDKDVRHGVPIRVDRAESVDFNCMMYGDEVGKAAAAAVKKNKSNNSAKATSKSTGFNYAAALARGKAKKAAQQPKPKKAPVTKSKKSSTTPKRAQAKQRKAAKPSPKAARPTKPSVPKPKRGWEKKSTTVATKQNLAKLAEIKAANAKEEEAGVSKAAADKKSAEAPKAMPSPKVGIENRARKNKPRAEPVRAEPRAVNESVKTAVSDAAESRPKPALSWGAKKSFADILKEKAQAKKNSDAQAAKV